MDYEKLRDYFNSHDSFSIHNGIKLVKMEPGYAEVETVIQEQSKNFMGTIHGGLLYALADIAAGSALFCYGKHCVTLSTNVQYIKPVAKGRVLAIANQIHKGKRTGVFDVSIYNEKQEIVCKSTVSMFITDNDVEI